jgi:SAM-dependent methyltransferase
VVEQCLVFDEVAELYDRVRPGYPAPLVDDVIELSGIAAGGRVLEIGAGTGLATELFARRGFRILGLEPGAAMRERARARLAGFANVELAPSTFEDWRLEGDAFELVISAQAFHWVAPEVRFAKSAAALREDAALAVFGNVELDERTPLRAALDDAYARHAPALLGRSGAAWYSERETIEKSFADSACFGPVAFRSYPWSRAFTADEYVDLLRTHSNHRLLPAAQREVLHAAVRDAFERHGGRAEVRYEAQLYLARSLRH